MIELISLYDTLMASNKNVCPIAHTYISAHIGVLIDKNGKFICALPGQAHELIPAPCTVRSSCRTGGVFPHLLHDNLSYVAGIGKYPQRRLKYLEQLENYTQNVNDEYAKAVLKYVKKNTIMQDAAEVIAQLPKTFQISSRNVIFCVLGMENDGEDQIWSEYYPKTLPQNGICCITGERDFIPESYPGYIISPSEKSKLFLSGSHVGYIASEKIIHALQYLVYAKRNESLAEIEYNFQKVINGDLPEKNFIDWITRKYNINQG